MKNLPIALIYSRLFIGILIVVLSFYEIKNYNIIAVSLFTIGLLTDIFDGIIARYLKISTSKLRRLDSTIDQLFFMMIALATFIQCPNFFYENKVQLIVLLVFEGLTYLFCFIKFKKEIATHAISSKIWTLILFATLIQIMVTSNSGSLFQICFYLGVVTRIEILGIIFCIREWTNDVPSLYHAILLRQGKSIKRHKLFNG